MKEQVLLTYLEYKTAPYIVTIDGEWGAGKTKFIKNFIDKHNEQYKFIYCSLNGFKNIDQVEKHIIVSFENFATKTLNLLTNTAFEYVKQKYFVDIKKRNVFTKNNLFKMNNQFKDEFLKDFDETVLVFDDIERYVGKFEELFGFILKIFEIAEKKTILIGDFSKFNDDEKKIYNERIINKIIGINLYITSNPEEGFENFITLFEENKKLLTNYKYNILETFNMSQKHNLRSLKSTLIILNDFFTLLKKHEATDLLEDDGYLNDLTKYLTAYTIEKMQNGMSIFEPVGASINSKNKEEVNTDKYNLEMELKKYGISRYIQPPIQEEDIKKLFQGNFEEIDNYLIFIKSHHKYFSKTKLWKVLYDFKELSDEGYNSTLTQIFKEYTEYKIIDSFDFLHSTAILLYLKSKNLFSNEFTSDLAIKIFDEVKNNSAYKPNEFEKRAMHDASLGYVYYGYESEDFQKVYKHVLEYDTQKILQNYLQDFTTDFQTYLKTKDLMKIKHYFVFVENKSNLKYDSIEILNLVPESFFDSIISLEPHYLYQFFRLLGSRIDRTLSEEVGLKLFLNKLTEQIKKEENVRKTYLFDDFIRLLKRKIKDIESYKETPPQSSHTDHNHDEKEQ